MEPPDDPDLLALVRCAAARPRPGDADRAHAAGLTGPDGTPTPEGRRALDVLVSLVARATRRGP